MVVWITGASSGIGEALARECSKKGADLILSSRRLHELERVAKSCDGDSDKIKILPLDLLESDQANIWVKDAIDLFGSIDILINNGGIGHLGDVVKMSSEVERQVMETNFWGHVNISKALLPHLIEKNSGSIVTIGSILGVFGSPGLAAYSASKHALYGYFESLRQELSETNLHIMLISPGFIKTNVTRSSLTHDGEVYGKDSTAQENGMDPKELANKIVRAISNGKDHALLGGWEIYSVPFKKIAPKTFYRTMRALTKRARKK